MRHSRKYIALGVLPLALLVGCGSGDTDTATEEGGSDWAPTGSVELVVGGGPGGGSDILGRTFARELQESTDVNVSVTNLQPLEAELDVFASAQDPEVLGVGNYSNTIIDPIEHGLDYSAEDFSQIGVIAADILYLVSPSGRFESTEDMLEEAKETPLMVAQVGGGGVHKMIVDQLSEALDVQLETVGYDGGGDQMNAVVAGDVDLAITAPGAFMTFVEAEQVDVMLSTGTPEYTSPELEDVPYANDFGSDESYPIFWRNLYAPPEITDAELEYWVNAVRDWTESESYQEYLTTNQMSEMVLFGDELAELIQADQEHAEASF